MTRKLRWALVGGGVDAFIGAVHRHAAALDGQYELVAGALSSTPERAQASGRALGLPEDRIYDSWEQLLERERARPDPVEVISIVTPNHLHFPVALASIRAGFHVICDKPLVHTADQAHALEAAVGESGTLFAVTYNYSGYPLVRQAREMVLGGALGKVRKVQVVNAPPAEADDGWEAQQALAWREMRPEARERRMLGLLQMMMGEHLGTEEMAVIATLVGNGTLDGLEFSRRLTRAVADKSQAVLATEFRVLIEV